MGGSGPVLHYMSTVEKGTETTFSTLRARAGRLASTDLVKAVGTKPVGHKAPHRRVFTLTGAVQGVPSRKPQFDHLSMGGRFCLDLKEEPEEQLDQGLSQPPAQSLNNLRQGGYKQAKLEGALLASVKSARTTMDTVDFEQHPDPLKEEEGYSIVKGSYGAVGMPLWFHTATGKMVHKLVGLELQTGACPATLRRAVELKPPYIAACWGDASSIGRPVCPACWGTLAGQEQAQGRPILSEDL